MSEQTSGLSERRIMVATHLLQIMLRDADNAASMLQDLEGEAEKLGATSEDIEVIVSYFRDVEQKIKEKNKYGWW